ncbi:glycosyltransferase family 4 protein [Atopobacter phocae]|uniref:glycosyltransferase family 4 protein n=1 Tax=Atopobacter phocae TaxID=136492 RepID=UPI000471A856|nr:MraY family glycosyltransferase [Atopobacter phocae]
MIYIRALCSMIFCIIVSYTLTKLLHRKGQQWNWLDQPRERHIHTQPVVTMGGLALHFSFWLTFFLFFKEQFSYFTSVLIASSVLVGVGVLDDLYELSPLKKSIGIILASLIVVMGSELTIHSIHITRFFDLPLPPLIGSLAVLVWLFVMSNAMNLMDGLDGLASGVSLIALTTMGIIFYLFIEPTPIPQLVIVMLLFASVVGFIPMNWHPAKIYLGDTGALWLGFMLAIVSLIGIKNTAFLSLILPVSILALPLSDLLFVMMARFIKVKPLFKGDRRHLHHRLLKSGYSHRQSVYLIYTLSGIFSLASLASELSENMSILFIAGGILLGAWLLSITNTSQNK